MRAVNTELRYYMDFWSFSTNDEVNAVILNKEFAAELEKMFARDIAASHEIRNEGVVCASTGTWVVTGSNPTDMKPLTAP